MSDEPTANEKCDHGNAMDGTCDLCEKDYWSLIAEIQRAFGDGDRKKGAAVIEKEGKKRGWYD